MDICENCSHFFECDNMGYYDTCKAKEVRTICITAGMTFEFEAIRTNAPKELIEEQLKLNCAKEESGETVDAYGLLEEQGYVVISIGSHDNMDMPQDAEMYDYYDYYE